MLSIKLNLKEKTVFGNIKKLFLTLPLLLQANDVPLSTFQDIPLLKRGGIQLEKAIDKGSLYLINAKAHTPQGTLKVQIFVTKDKQTVLFGEAFHAQTGEMVSIPLDMKPFESKATLIWGKGEKTYYIVTDPECPYCKEFEQHLPSLSNQYRFVIFLFPLPHHPHAKMMSYDILSGKTEKEKFERLIATTKKEYVVPLANHFTQSEKDNFELRLAEQEGIVKELGVEGTPSVYDEQGRTIPWTQLVSKP